MTLHQIWTIPTILLTSFTVFTFLAFCLDRNTMFYMYQDHMDNNFDGLLNTMLKTLLITTKNAHLENNDVLYIQVYTPDTSPSLCDNIYSWHLDKVGSSSIRNIQGWNILQNTFYTGGDVTISSDHIFDICMHTFYTCSIATHISKWRQNQRRKALSVDTSSFMIKKLLWWLAQLVNRGVLPPPKHTVPYLVYSDLRIYHFFLWLITTLVF
jgi:hypothetical protein